MEIEERDRHNENICMRKRRKQSWDPGCKRLIWAATDEQKTTTTHFSFLERVWEL